jgi:hypothetical protein
MAKSDDKPPEQKPTLNQEAVDDLLWDIPFARPIWKLFVREGKAVKTGWVAFVVIVGITFYFTHSWTEGDVDKKISDATNYFGGVVSDLKGQLSDAKQDRDKYQMMLAPFEAFAMAKYTNAPIDQRFDLFAANFSAGLAVITNALNNIESGRPTFELLIDGFSIANNQTVPLKESREFKIGAGNKGEITAKNVTIDFSAPIDATNLVFSTDWHPEPSVKQADGKEWNHWLAVSMLSGGKGDAFIAAPLTISTNFTAPFLPLKIKIHSDESKTQIYDIIIAIPSRR